MHWRDRIDQFVGAVVLGAGIALGLAAVAVVLLGAAELLGVIAEVR